MATTKMTVITLEKLALYDSNIKNYINTADAKSIKTVAIEGNVLKFYKVEEPVGDTEPAYQIELPETDISNLLEKFEAATAGNVVTVAEDGKNIVDSGIKATDLALKSEVEAVGAKADANAESIEAINDAETGILKQAKDYADGKDTAIAEAKAAGESAQGAAEKAQSDVDKLAERVTANEGKIGDTENLETSAKDDLVSAINEVRNAVQAGGTDAALTIDTTTTTDGMLKSYTIKQGNNTIGVIDIPKELMAVSGRVVENPEGMDAGTYIELTIQNGDPVYINVASLIENYTAEQGATQIQLAVDAETRVISASIVAGSVGTTELADNAITTVKIADGNVTKAKLSTAVQESLDKADKALDEANAYTDEKNTAMDERMKAVEAVLGDGEGSVTDQIADAEQRAKDAASEDATTKANQALADAKTYTNEEVAKDRARLEALETDTHKHTNLELLETYTQTEADLADAVAKKHEHANADVLNGIDADDVTKWDNAEQNAKDYADGQINTAIEEAKTDASNKDAVVLAEAQKGIAAVQTSVDGVAEDVADHESRLAAIEEIEFVEASEDDILGMFNTTA